MSLWENAKAELHRSPIATIAAITGVLIGIGAIAVTWWLAPVEQIAIPSASGSSARIGLPSGRATNGSTALVAIAVFLALTPSLASLSRILYRINRYAAVPISVVIAALSIFLNRLNTIILGYPVDVSPKSLSIDNLIFYGTVLMFLAVASRKPIADFVGTGQKVPKSEEDASNEALGTFGAIVIMILIWGGLVGWSQSQLMQAFLS